MQEKSRGSWAGGKKELYGRVNLQEETEKIEQQYQGELGRIFLKEVTVMQKGPRANEKVCSI